MKNKLGGLTRLFLLIGALGLLVVLFTPIWRIELTAPQYPEGLSLTIHANGLKGNVDIINGLNHYIGMKTLHNVDFYEFIILPYAIVFFALAFVFTAVLNKRKWLNVLLILFVIFGIIAMVDFWKWEYNYGHHLDPNAAIVVPGMSYQPPLIGFKQLLNFGAYSVPDTGGWLFIANGVILLGCVIMEWRKSLAPGKSKLPFKAFIIPPAILLLLGCSSGPEPIAIGKDSCYSCRMIISDLKYGAEIVTKKGKTYKFDDVHCLLSFLKGQMIKQQEVKNIYASDFAGNHSLINVNECYFLRGDDIHAPMNGHVIAFQHIDSAIRIARLQKVSQIRWEELTK